MKTKDFAEVMAKKYDEWIFSKLYFKCDICKKIKKVGDGQIARKIPEYKIIGMEFKEVFKSFLEEKVEMFCKECIKNME